MIDYLFIYYYYYFRAVTSAVFSMSDDVVSASDDHTIKVSHLLFSLSFSFLILLILEPSSLYLSLPLSPSLLSLPISPFSPHLSFSLPPLFFTSLSLSLPLSLSQIWDLHNMRYPVASIRLDCGINRISVSHDRHVLAVPLDNSHIRLYDLGGNRIATLPHRNRKVHMDGSIHVYC